MIGHNDIMAAKDHQQQNTNDIDAKCRHRIYHVCQSGANDENAKDPGDAQQTMRCFDSKICLTQHQHSQKYHNAYDTVVISKRLAEQCNEHHAECHDQIYFKIVDQNVASFFFFIRCTADQVL